MSVNSLHVAAVQCPLAWEDKAANLARISQLLQPLRQPVDLIVLPEMFSTGFSMRAAELAEPMNGDTVQWMACQAAELNAVIAGSFIAKDGDRYYNRLVWMPPNGRFQTYDKRHCFSPAGEQEHYTPGREMLIAELKGWKVMPLICYDLRFPVWSRNVHGYDLLLYVANWPERRRHAWSSLLTARAIENQAYTLGVNRIGADGHGVSHSGDSLLLDFAGRILYHAADREEVFFATLDYEAQQVFRRQWPFLEDRDRFLIEKG